MAVLPRARARAAIAAGRAVVCVVVVAAARTGGRADNAEPDDAGGDARGNAGPASRLRLSVVVTAVPAAKASASTGCRIFLAMFLSAFNPPRTAGVPTLRLTRKGSPHSKLRPSLAT
jgi:hypothetical protein